MKSPYKENFVKAMVHKIKNHTSREHWEHVRKSDAPAFLILRTTWKFRTKKNKSTGSMIKFKARICADG